MYSYIYTHIHIFTHTPAAIRAVALVPRTAYAPCRRPASPLGDALETNEDATKFCAPAQLQQTQSLHHTSQDSQSRV